MRQIKNLDLENVIKEIVYMNKPFLGICLGFQLLFEYSKEFEATDGLGVINGHVEHLSNFGGLTKIPHVGWNKIHIAKMKNFSEMNIFDNEYFYFVHSYAAIPQNKELILSKTKIENIEFCSSIKQKIL